MKLLVPGCAGFIGWKVSELALQSGHDVIGVDNLNDAYDVRLKRWRLEQLRPLPGFGFRPMDICDRHAVDALFREHRFDAVIDLAARAGVRESLNNPWVYYDTNVTGALNLLSACQDHHVGKFILASTSSLYAGSSLPFSEEQSTDRPLSPYAASKKAAETLASVYASLHGVDVTVLRYFTVYGPAGRPDMSPFRFVQQIFEERPVTVYGDGLQSRDFTYVDDIARGTLAALRPQGYEIINLGSDRAVALIDAIRTIEDLVGNKAELVHLPRHPADMPATWASISKAQRLLGWEPRTSLEEGLKHLVTWYRNNRSWARDIETGASPVQV